MEVLAIGSQQCDTDGSNGNRREMLSCTAMDGRMKHGSSETCIRQPLRDLEGVSVLKYIVAANLAVAVIKTLNHCHHLLVPESP